MKALLTGILLIATSIVSAQSADTVKVLFIGNSFTFMNEMPELFKGIAKSKGKNVLVEKVVQSG